MELDDARARVPDLRQHQIDRRRPLNEPESIREMLKNTKTIAVVGLTDREGRASYGVSRFMQQQGYRIVPVNPRITESLGEKAYPTLDAAVAAHPRGSESEIQMVNVFRAPEFVPEIVEEAIRLKLPYLWLQEGVVHEQAAARAEAAGMRVVMDHCLLKAYMAEGWARRV
jgi:predicted CoA-binding protein